MVTIHHMDGDVHHMDGDVTTWTVTVHVGGDVHQMDGDRSPHGC